MVARISNQDYLTLKHVAGLQKPNKVWIRGDLSVKKASRCGKFFWGIAKLSPRMQKTFYGLNVRKSERSLAKLRVKIIRAENKAGHFSQNLRTLYNSSVDNFQKVSRINKPALAALKFAPAQKLKPQPLKPQPRPQPPLRPQANVKPQAPIQPSMPTTAAKVRNFTVGSYNVLFPQTFAHTHPHATDVGYHENAQGEIVDNSAYRIQVISKNIRNADLDVNCLQEVSKEFFETLQKNLGDKYVGVWAPHFGPMPKPGSSHQVNNQGVVYNPKANNHGVAIFYKKDQFNMLQSHASRFVNTENGKIRKRHLMLDLQDKKTGLVTRYATCHLTDPRQWTQNKTQHINSVLKDAHRDYKVDMIVVAGDMNQDQFGDLETGMPRKPADLLSATAFQPLLANGYKHGAENLNPGNFPSTEIERADNDYSPNGKLVPTGRMIDHIFMKNVNANIKPTIKLTGVPQNFDERGSDHKMVVSVISVQ